MQRVEEDEMVKPRTKFIPEPQKTLGKGKLKFSFYIPIPKNRKLR
jgi:hypothetical protein